MVYVLNIYGNPLMPCKEAKRKLNSVKVSKIYQLDKQRNLIKIFNSTRETERNGFSKWMIRQCCNHERDTYKGFIWMYESEYLENIKVC